jgi:hypothetical protein
MTGYINEKPRRTEVIRECDVLVAGGGIAGIAAALSAARAGAKVVLLERQYILGGLGTSGLITIYLPLCDGMGRQVSFGIAEELLRLSIKHGAEADYPKHWLEGGSFEERRDGQRFLVRYNPHIFAILAEQLLLSEGVEILYGSDACGVDMEDGSINAIIIENKSGRSAIKVRSVVDASGDADIYALSGAGTELFGQGNVAAAWYYYTDGTKYDLRPIGWSDTPEKYKTDKTPAPLVSRRFGGIDGTELSENTVLSHKMILDDVLERRKINPSYFPVTIPGMPQMRMTRRLRGLYTLDDEEAGVHFPDSIGMISDWRKKGPVYEIPFRTLYGGDVRNLVAAGRCISVTDAMWDISRVIPACAVTGQAAGLAAALSSDFPALDVSRLRDRLSESGVKTCLK